MIDGGLRRESVEATGAIVLWRGVNWVLPLILLCWFLAGCARPTEEAASASVEWTLPSNAEIEALLARRMENNGVGVVVGVIDRTGQRVASYGRSGAENQRPLDGDTVFQLGSVTKGFTSLLLADMVARGEVGLHDPASKYLPPDVILNVNAREFTLYDLATHRSGLPSMPTNLDLNGKPNPIEAYSEGDLYDFLRTYEPENAPGEVYTYSNLGVSLLGRLLADRARTTYEEFVTERVLEPLGMSDTSITLRDDQLARLAPGHSPYMKPIDTWEMATLQASGSLRSTANDMLKLIAACLEPDSTPLAAAVGVQLLEGEPQAGQQAPLIWGRLDDGTYRHSGGKAGYRSGVAFNPQTGIGAVVLANSRTDDLPINLAVHLVNGEPMPPTPAPRPYKPVVALSALALDKFVGAYRFQNDFEMEVVRNGPNLLVRYPDTILEFEAFRDREFFYNAGNDDITFELDAEGDVAAMILYSEGRGVSEPRRAERIN